MATANSPVASPIVAVDNVTAAGGNLIPGIAGTPVPSPATIGINGNLDVISGAPATVAVDNGTVNNSGGATGASDTTGSGNSVSSGT